MDSDHFVSRLMCEVPVFVAAGWEPDVYCTFNVSLKSLHFRRTATKGGRKKIGRK